MPDGWAWSRIYSIAFVTKLAGFEYTNYIAVNLATEGVPLFKGKNIQGDKIIYDFESFIPYEISNELPRSQVNKKCILLPYVGTLGNVGIHKKEGIFHLGSNVGKIELTCNEYAKILQEEFVVLYLTSSFGFKGLVREKKATAQDSISIQAIRNVCIPIPPIKEQKRIIEHIESWRECMDCIDADAADLEKSITLAKQKILDLAIRGKLVPQDPADEPASELLKKIKAEKEALVKAGKLKKDKHESFIFKSDDNCYHENIDGKVTDITDEIPFDLPDGWVWCRLENLASYKKGPFGSSITKAMFVPKGCNTYKIYEQKNAIQKNANIGDYFISEQKFNELKNFEVHPGDIIVSCAGTIGETFVLPPEIYPGIINQALMKIKLCASEIKDFYLLYFDYILKAEANEKGKGSAMKNIPPFDVLKKMLLPLPPLAEQKRIVSQVEKLFSVLETMRG